MEGVYPAVIFGILAFCAVWWFVRTRDAIALKRVVADLKANQTAETDRGIAAIKALINPKKKRAAPQRVERSSSYGRDSDEG